MGYNTYIRKFRRIVSQIQARPSYRPDGTNVQMKTANLSGGCTSNNSITQKLNHTKVDYEGDTGISGVKAILSALNEKYKANVNAIKAKPLAPWKSQAELDKLMKNDRCIL